MREWSQAGIILLSRFFFKCDYKYTFADVLMTASPNKTQNKHALTLEQCAILQNL